MSGTEGPGAQRLSNRISYRLDSEVSPPHPESWRPWVSAQTFSEGAQADTGMRDRHDEHTGGSYPHGDDHPTQICGERGDGNHQRDDE